MCEQQNHTGGDKPANVEQIRSFTELASFRSPKLELDAPVAVDMHRLQDGLQLGLRALHVEQAGNPGGTT